MTWDGAFPFVTLTCVAPSGKPILFEVRVEGARDAEVDVSLYYAKPLPPERQGHEEYFASLKRVGPDLLQLDGMNNGLPAQYQRCGITRALLPHIAVQHSARIRSSRHCPSEDETHTPAARRVWQRMVDDGSARYDATEDRFYYAR
jgi:hypothetical protein